VFTVEIFSATSYIYTRTHKSIFEILLKRNHEIPSSLENSAQNQLVVHSYSPGSIVCDFPVWIISEHSPGMHSLDGAFIGGARAQRCDMRVISDLDRFAGLHAERKFSVCVNGELKGAGIMQDDGNFESGKHV